MPRRLYTADNVRPVLAAASLGGSFRTSLSSAAVQALLGAASRMPFLSLLADRVGTPAHDRGHVGIGHGAEQGQLLLGPPRPMAAGLQILPKVDSTRRSPPTTHLLGRQGHSAQGVGFLPIGRLDELPAALAIHAPDAEGATFPDSAWPHPTSA